ncbi:GrpB family protein [Oceanotoga sp. DSM 15011]|nr:GrpB family protein [Oceanotoga sp. DSM 15011]UYP00346.1 GrpB family protein [Oceanotoga sp. DSM 15011]
MIGLKRGTVKLFNHEKEWELEAQRTISRLHKILGSVASDIQHVGSTSVFTIKAKPIIDIAVAVDNFKDVLALEKEFINYGFYYRPNANLKGQLLFACGSYYDGTGDLQTHFIHIVLKDSMEWINYINFRDYLNKMPKVAKAYENLKLSLVETLHSDKCREEYLRRKNDFIVYTLRKALVNYYLGKTVKIKIDRPIGSSHPKYSDLIYPVNYGYIPGVLGGDGEELDVYLLGIDNPVKNYIARIIGIIHRHNDIEDKLVAAPEGINFTKTEIKKILHFQEQYYKSDIEIIPPYKFISKKVINKGWSCDKKYCVITDDGIKYLLRITPKEKSANRENIFRIQKQLASLDVSMCKPVELGKCKEGIYILQTWIDGKDAEEIIPHLTNSEQYYYGLEAGKMLKIIHSIPAPKNHPDWEFRFNAKMDSKIKMYNECHIKFDGAKDMISYMNSNRHLLANRPQTFQHGDYHIGNMMIEKNKIVIIDFDRYDFGDPWEEFNRIVWCVQISPMFASGIINGYFDNKVPFKFWKLLALYISSNTLSSIPWAIKFGESEVNTMLNQAKNIMNWYNNMQNPIPTWYRDIVIK